MELILGKIDISALVKAYNRLNEALFYSNKKDESYPISLKQTAAIQCFEFVYELSWKMMKRVLYEKGVLVNSPKDSFREAFKESLITDIEKWFRFQECRNLTVHTYDEEIVSEIYAVLPEFAKEVELLINNLEKFS